MEIPSRLGPEWLYVTVVASGLAAEEFVATGGGRFVKG